MFEIAPPVSVIVAVNNAKRTLGRQLSALALQESDYQFQTIVVLNRCTDRTIDVASTFASKLNLDIIEANERISIAYARNAGAAASLGKNLIFCDGDGQAEVCWVKEMSLPLISGDAQLVGANIRLNKELIPSWMYKKYYESLGGPELQWYLDAFRYPSGVSLGITRQAFQSVGGFDEKFIGAGGEDIDLTIRLLRNGFKVVEAPNAVMNYQPQRRMRSVIGQRRNNFAGEAMLLAKADNLPPYKPFAKLIWSATRAAAASVIRRREYQPTLPTMAFLDSIFRDVTINKMHNGHQGVETVIHDQLTDFVVSPSTPIVGGLAFACAPNVAGWWARAGVESSSLHLLDSLLDSGGTFVDVGANVGVFSVAAARKVGLSGHVISFEANPLVSASLVTNATRHGVSDQISVENIAVGAESGEQVFFQYSNDLVSSFYPAPAINYPGEVVSELPVLVTALDTACQLKIDLLKVDVEGAEHSVFTGAKRILGDKQAPIVIFEWNPATIRAASTQGVDLLGHFPLSDWTLWLVDDDPESRVRLTPLGLSNTKSLDNNHSGWYRNVLAVPHLRRPSAIQRLQYFIGN